MYVSNENPTLVDVYFDDVVMTHTKSNVIQYNACLPEPKRRQEYYPGNNFLGNGGTELNTTSNLYDLDYRNYDPILGRMNGIDPMATKYASLSPYNFSFNDPVTFNDPSGADPYQRSDDTWWVADRRSLYGSKYSGFQGNPQGWAFANQGRMNSAMISDPWAWTGMSSAEIYGTPFGMAGTIGYDYSITTPSEAWTEHLAKIFPGDVFSADFKIIDFYVNGDRTRYIDSQIDVYWGSLKMMGAGFRDPSLSQTGGGSSVLQASLFPTELGNANGLLNAGSTLVGAGELGIQYIRQYPNGPSQIARGINNIVGSRVVGTQSTANFLSKAFNGTKSLGKNLGGFGAILSTGDYLFNGGEKNGYEHANYWIGMGVFALTVLNPATAVIGVVYGAVQLGSYLYNGKSAEENIGKALGF
jgi:RHS repeat-associated protein